MACCNYKTSIAQKLGDPEFEHWLRVSLAVQYTKEALQDFVTSEIGQLHRELRSQGACFPCKVEHMGSTPAPTCPHSNEICEAHCTLIKRMHRSNNPSWNHTKDKTWCNEPWEIAKCFLPPHGYSETSQAQDCDFNGIISIMINYKGFEKSISDDLSREPNICTNAKTVGKIAHNSSFVLDKESLQYYLKILITLLSDQGLARDSKVQDGLKKVNELQKGDTEISKCTIKQVFLEAEKLARAELHHASQAFAREAIRTTEQDTMKSYYTIKSFIALMTNEAVTHVECTYSVTERGNKATLKKHKYERATIEIAKNKIKVHKYAPDYENVQLKKRADDHSLNFPEPVIITDINIDKGKFVKESERHRNVIEKQLSNCFAKVSWPRNETDTTSTICTPNTNAANYLQMVKEREHTVKCISHAQIKDIGVIAAKEQITNLARSVEMLEHTITMPGLCAYMQSMQGKNKIQTIESTYDCAIEIKSPHYQNADKSPCNTILAKENSGTKILARCNRVFSNRDIFAVVGDMTELPVDILVATTDEKLNLTRGLGGIVTFKGGESIHKCVQDYILKNGSQNPGNIFVCSGGNLKAQYIVHAVEPACEGGVKNEDALLLATVFKSMKEAHLKKAKSIVIPGISCGAAANSFPVKKAASIIVRAIKIFFQEYQDSSVTEVYLCDTEMNVVNEFIDALKLEFGDHHITRLGSPEAETVSASKRENDQDRVKFGNINVSLIIGDLSKQRVDVIANTTSKTLDLKTGGVSASLLAVAGQQMQDEIKANYPNGLTNEHQIAVTSGHNLKCHSVLHVALPSWSGRDETSVKALHKNMFRCMTESQERNYTSVAFPAMGTGTLGFPSDVVAKEMFAVVYKFSQDYPQSTINDVRVIVYDKDFRTINTFKKVISCLPTDNPGNVHSNIGYTSANTSGQQLKQNTGGDYDSSSRSYKFGSIHIIVKSGDITQEDVDCIVNSTNEILDLTKGGVSRSILKKGDFLLQDELNRKRPNMMRKKLVMTNAPNLKCKRIMHIDAQDDNTGWSKIVCRCLCKAENKKMSSLAFPAFGTGVFSTTPGEIAEIMVKAVTDFQKTKHAHLKEIRIVTLDTNMLQIFHNVLTIKSTCKSTDHSHAARGVHLNASETDTVTFGIRPMALAKIKQAIPRLELRTSEDRHHEVFESCITEYLTDDQVKGINAFAHLNHVSIKEDTARETIEIDGFRENVIHVSNKIRSTIDTTEMNTNVAALGTSFVQWYSMEKVFEESKLIPYNTLLNDEIEYAYKSKETSLNLEMDGERYILDFSSMTQSATTRKYCVNVIRKDFTEGEQIEQRKDDTCESQYTVVFTVPANCFPRLAYAQRHGKVIIDQAKDFTIDLQNATPTWNSDTVTVCAIPFGSHSVNISEDDILLKKSTSITKESRAYINMESFVSENDITNRKFTILIINIKCAGNVLAQERNTSYLDNIIFVADNDTDIEEFKCQAHQNNKATIAIKSELATHICLLLERILFRCFADVIYVFRTLKSQEADKQLDENQVSERAVENRVATLDSLEKRLIALFKQSKVPKSEYPTHGTELISDIRTDPKTIFEKLRKIKGVKSCGYSSEQLEVFVERNIDRPTAEEERDQRIKEILQEFNITRFKINSITECHYNAIKSGSKVIGQHQVKGEQARFGTLGAIVNWKHATDGIKRCALTSQHVVGYSRQLYWVQNENRHLIGNIVEIPKHYNKGCCIAVAKLLPSYENQIEYRFQDSIENLLNGKLFPVTSDHDLLPVYLRGASTILGSGCINITMLVAERKDMILIQDSSNNSSFCSPGDSGAIVFSDDPEGKVVNIVAMLEGEYIICKSKLFVEGTNNQIWENNNQGKSRTKHYAALLLHEGLDELKNLIGGDLKLVNSDA